MPPTGAHKRAVNRTRRKHLVHEEHDSGAERWLVTYADMLTLLLVLFIVLYSISVVNTSKFISLKTSLAAVFGTSGNGKSILAGGDGLNENDNTGQGTRLVMPGLPVQRATANSPATSDPTTFPKPTAKNGYTTQDVQREVADYKAIEKAISNALAHNNMKSDVQYQITSRGLVITLVTNSLVFPGNSANLEPAGQDILKVIATPLARQTRNIEVDGFTNQAKVSTYPYPSGWELSSARASAVVRYFAGHGIPESRLTAVGYSDQHPLYPASDPRAFTRNRRVEVVVLSSLPTAAGTDLATAAAADGQK
ncbi:MAG TPA: flagellar motor protein MotB [Jatrophihabitans sp.]|jgi:chemotaxis protein MotB|nr:flagellar motor protein MotB [Jatrophihabitans sp.]